MPRPRTRTRILIVEDEDPARIAGGQYFESIGCAVDTAANGAEARRRADRHPPDVVICDWRLGKGDGVELARELQARFGLRLILMTADSLVALRAASADLVVDRYFRKPVSLENVAAVVFAEGAASRNGCRK